MASGSQSWPPPPGSGHGSGHGSGRHGPPPGFSGGSGSSPQQAQRFGRYTLVRELGRGAFGVVYLARDPQLVRDVAIKILTQGGERALARFEREVRATARLRHSGIVSVHESGQAGGRPYLVMEHVEGEDLAAMVAGERRVAPSRAAEVIREAALAIAHAHEAGVLHRDIKPQNLMLDADGAVRVLDFGLAFLEEFRREGLSQEGQPLGTPAYMAPEQLRGERVDGRADVYGLGATLYHLLTGVSPLEGAAHPMVVLRWTTPPAPSERASTVSAALDAITQRCMAVTPRDRYATPLELAEALDAFLQGPVEAPAKATWAAPAAILALGALVAGTVLIVGLGSRPEEPVLAGGAKPVPETESPSPGGGAQSESSRGVVRARELLRDARKLQRTRARSDVIMGRLDEALSLSKADSGLHVEVALCRIWHLLNRTHTRRAQEAAAALVDSPGRAGLEARLALAMALASEGQRTGGQATERAREVLEALSRDDPQGALGLVAASTQAGLGESDYDAAARSARQALALEPDFVPALLAEALALVNLNREGEAGTLLQRIASDLQPDSVRAQLGLAVVSLRQASSEQSLEHLDLVERLVAPEENALVLLLRGQIAMSRRSFALAIANLRRSLELEPTRAAGWFLLGMCHTQVGEQSEAEQAWRRGYAEDAEAITEVLETCRPAAIQARARRLLGVPFPGGGLTPEQRQGVSDLVLALPASAHADAERALHAAAEGAPLASWRGRVEGFVAAGRGSPACALLAARLYASRAAYDAARSAIEAAGGAGGDASAVGLQAALLDWERGLRAQAQGGFAALARADPQSAAGIVGGAMAGVLAGRPADRAAAARAAGLAPRDPDVLSAAAYVLAEAGDGEQAQGVAGRALARYGLLVPIAARVQARVLVLGAQGLGGRPDSRRLDAALVELSRVLAASDGASARLAGARWVLELPPTQPWAAEGALWVAEAKAREPERADLALVEGAYLMRAPEATREGVLALWRSGLRQDPGLAIPAEFVEAFSRRFGALDTEGLRRGE